MRLRQKLISGIVAAFVTLAPAAGETFDAGTDSVFQKAVGVNRGLQSYTARIDVEARVFFGRFHLHGTVYHRGDRSTVLFDRVPAIARAAVSNMPTVTGPGDWPRSYAMSIGARSADTTTFRLVPLAPEHVRSIDVVVSNATGLIMEYVWSTVDGQTITSDETYETIGEYQLVRSTETTTRGAGINTNSTTLFTDYALNATVPDSILAASP
jgi:hypothetical protein